MAAPTFVAFYGPTTAGTTATQSATITVAAGDVIYLAAYTGFFGRIPQTPSGGGLTWSLVRSQATQADGMAPVVVWRAQSSSAQTFTCSVSVTGTGTNEWNWHAQRWSGSSGTGAVAGTDDGGTAPSLAITTTAVDSSIMLVVNDYNAVTSATRTYRTGAGAFSETRYVQASASLTAFIGYHLTPGAVGAKTVGMTAPTGQKPTVVAVEILGVTSAVQQGAGTASANSNAIADGTNFTTLQGAGTASANTNAIGDGDNFPNGSGAASGNSNATGAGFLSRFGAGTASGNANGTGAGSVTRKIETIVEDWQAGYNAGKWSAIDGVRVQVTGGRLRMTTGAAVNSPASISSVNRFTLVDSSIYAQFDYDPATHVGSSEILLRLIAPGSGNRAEWLLNGGSASVRTYSNSVADATYGVISSQRGMFFRIRNAGGGSSGGTLVFETSMDAVVWTQRGSKTVAWDLSDVQVQFTASHWDSTAGDAVVFVDNVNVPLEVLQGAGVVSGNAGASGAGFVTRMSNSGTGSAATDAFGDGTRFDPANVVLFSNLTGTFIDSLGDPIEGSVILTPGVRHRIDRVNNRLVTLRPRVVPLTGGQFSTMVPGNGGPNGAYWRWTCEVVQNASPSRYAFEFVIPVGAISIDIADCTVR